MPRGIPEERELPEFDARARTEFLRRTMARALTPKAQRRVHGLLQMERLHAELAAGRGIGNQALLLGSIARAFPVSSRAMQLELRGRGPQNYVHLAERIELGLWIRPDWDRISTRQE